MPSAITAAGGPDKQKVADAMKTMAVSTLVGNLDWAKGPFPNVAKTPLVGGQWRQTDGGQFPYDLVVVSNEHAKEQGRDVPLGGEFSKGKAGLRGECPEDGVVGIAIPAVHDVGDKLFAPPDGQAESPHRNPPVTAEARSLSRRGRQRGPVRVTKRDHGHQGSFLW